MFRALKLLAIAVFMLGLIGCQKGTEITTRPATTPQNKVQLTRAQIAMLELAAEGNTAAVKDLLANGVDVNMRGNDNNTPIMEAAYAGKTETVKLLLDHGADLSAKKNDGETVITLGGGHPEIAALFKNVSALVAAAGKGDNNSINELVEKGTSVNALDTNGQSGLTEATWNGNTATVKLLLERGADPTIKKSDGQAPLALAQAQKHPEIVALLEQALAKRSQATRAADGK